MDIDEIKSEFLALKSKIALTGPEVHRLVEMVDTLLTALDERDKMIEGYQKVIRIQGETNSRDKAEVGRLRGLLDELVKWNESPEVQGAFALSANHVAGKVDSEFSKKAGELWKRVKAFKPKGGEDGEGR